MTRGPAASLVLALTTAMTGAVPGLAAATPGSVAAAELAHMTLAQRVGQLLMVGVPATGVPSSTLTLLRTYHVGSVILTGRSSAGQSATWRVVQQVRAQATSASTTRVPPLVATDQEGGYVQVLRGPGFSTMPTALTQGGWSASFLRNQATTWGRQLRGSGVTVDLAPVADTVISAAFAPSNAPIGHWYREFGFTASRVGAHTVAFLQGMAAAHVAATAKHFPGLGRVTANPDTSSGVTDRITTRQDADLEPFAAAVSAGVPLVMVSTVYYTRIDPAHPAAFSRIVVTGMLRGDLRFAGVIVSDDLGNARQVAAWAPGTRAVDFVRAGGDMVLTVAPPTVPAMFTALLHAAQTDGAFRSEINQSALRILTAKARLGLVN